MAIKGRLFQVAGEMEVELRLDLKGVADLKAALQRALNCWDPQHRPLELLDLSDKFDSILEEAQYDQKNQSSEVSASGRQEQSSQDR